MSDTLKLLRRMVKWCPSCKGDPENIKQIIHFPKGAFKVTYEDVDSCPTCREARALIAELETSQATDIPSAGRPPCRKFKGWCVRCANKCEHQSKQGVSREPGK